MRAAPLKQAKLNAANLDAGEVLFHDGSERRGQPAESRVTEAVACGGLGLRDKAAVGIVDALGHRGEYLAVGLINLIDVGKELIHIEIAPGGTRDPGRSQSERPEKRLPQASPRDVP